MLQALLDIGVARFKLLKLLGNLLVEFIRSDTKFLAPSVVEERYRRSVLYRTLEPVFGHVVAEYPSGDLIVFHQWRASEGDVESVWKRVALVVGEVTILRPVSLVDYDDDIVPAGVRLMWQDIFVELLNGRENVGVKLLNERENVGFVFTKQALEVLAAVSSHVFVFTDHPAPGIRPVDLIVEVVTVTQDQKREIAAELAVNLPTEEDP